MQAQLADAKAAAATATAAATNVDNNQNSEETLAAAAAQIMAQAENWRTKIDAIYQDILSAQENFYTMSSKEKLLKLRTQLKENTEKSRKTFNIDGEFMKRVSLNSNTMLFLFSMPKINQSLSCFLFISTSFFQIHNQNENKWFSTLQLTIEWDCIRHRVCMFAK